MDVILIAWYSISIPFPVILNFLFVTVILTWHHWKLKKIFFVFCFIFLIINFYFLSELQFKLLNFMFILSFFSFLSSSLFILLQFFFSNLLDKILMVLLLWFYVSLIFSSFNVFPNRYYLIKQKYTKMKLISQQTQ